MWRVITADYRDAMARLHADSIDAIVSDPPYELGFMGRKWDASGIAYDLDVWRACLRALKPGGHMAAFGGTRTYHRMACAIEDAGFDIRDSLHWIYGSGFPKSLDVSKAIKAAGQRWDGWGTALKPAHEPIVLARKPLIGTVAANVLEHGTGALNVDGCRVGTDDDCARARSLVMSGSPAGMARGRSMGGNGHESGRWPPNVLLSPPADDEMGRQSGVSASRANGRQYGGRSMFMDGRRDPANSHTDTGTAARFFPIFRYEAKASRAEREAGLGHLTGRTAGQATGRVDGSAGLDSPRAGAGRTALNGVRNIHPTVKPIALMRWLCRLVCPVGGLILDPFTGSGTTGIAAVLERFDFTGVELSAEYAAIARARIGYWEGARGLTADEARQRDADGVDRRGAQLGLFE